MDTETLDAYDRGAAGFAREWSEQPAPDDMYAMLRRFFSPGPTADIGCGSGRDAGWLAEHGFAAVGYDPSQGLLAQARQRYPEVPFHRAALPELAGVAEGELTNVLCETVIMHLEPEQVGPSVRRLLALLAPGGTLYLSWRVTEGEHRRDDHGRLYAVVDEDVVAEALSGARILLDERSTSASSGRTVRRVIAHLGAAAPVW